MRSLLMICVVFLSAFAVQAQPVVMCDGSLGYRECRVASSGVIVLQREMSERQCFEGVSWGTQSAGIVWVSRGCRAVFTVPKSPTDLPPRSSRVVCESEDGKRQVCVADVNQGVTLARQLSRNACIEGTTWGFNKVREQIWVEQGCRAEFIIGKLNEELPPVQALDSTLTCESQNGRRTNCGADTAAGVQLVKRLSDASCRFGREWGFDQKGIWVDKGCRAEFAVRARKTMARSVTCESKDNARVACPADTLYGIALIRQFNEKPCVLGESWGFDQDGIWVTNGCHGQFILGGFRLPPDAVPAAATLVTCESKDGDRTLCEVKTGRGVGLVRQLSEANCVLNRTWGYDASSIWVSEGCRAEFAVAK
jgi:hypothetical protein